MSDLEQAKKQWEEEKINPLLARFPERREEFKTTSGMKVERLYLPQDADPDYEEKLGFPGQYPFTRVAQPTMYRGRYWTLRRNTGFGQLTPCQSDPQRCKVDFAECMRELVDIHFPHAWVN